MHWAADDYPQLLELATQLGGVGACLPLPWLTTTGTTIAGMAAMIPRMITVLLATAGAVLATRPNTTEDELDNLVEARLARQAVLTRDDPPAPLLWALVDEGVLYRPVAPAGVMYDQLMDLARLSRLPNITIQVVPYSAGGHTGLLGAFVMADLGSSPGVVYVEDITDGRVFEDPDTVARVTLSYKSLQSEALPKGASRELIVRVAEERWKGTTS